MVWIKRGMLVLILLAASVYADSTAPDQYESRLYYETSGNPILAWGIRCNTDPSNPNHDGPAAVYSCPHNVGSASSPMYCAEQGDVNIRWRMYHEQDPMIAGSGIYVYTYVPDRSLYNINWDADAADCSCHGDDWFSGIGSTDSTYDYCCGDDGGADDWASWNQSTATGPQVRCYVCLDGANTVDVNLLGNGYLADGADRCYYGDVICTEGAQTNGANELCRDYCVDDNNGGPCIQTHNVSLAETCYYSDRCTDGVGCGYNNNRPLRQNFCDTCSATGNNSGDACFPDGTHYATTCFYSAQACTGNTCTSSQEALNCTAPDTQCCGAGDLFYYDQTCVAGVGAEGSTGDRDDNQSNCEYVGGGCTLYDWAQGGEAAGNLFGEYDAGNAVECCEDDAGEFYIIQAHNGSVPNMAVSAPACCDDTNDCVDDVQCFANASFRNVNTTNEVEVCDERLWRKMNPDECLFFGPDSWMPPFGAGTIPNCCGDQMGFEWLSRTNAQYACCNNSIAFVHSNNICWDYRSDVYGTVELQQLDGSYMLADGVEVRAKWPDFSDVNINWTYDNGKYNVSVPTNGTYTFVFFEPGYQTEIITQYIDQHTNIDVSMRLSSDCLEDCTRLDGGEYRCDPTCDGSNGCEYNASVVSQAPYILGMSNKELCDGALPGWTFDNNDTYKIKCCSEGFVRAAPKTPTVVEPSKGIKEFQTYFVGTVLFEPNAELMSVYVAVYSKE